MKVDKRRLNAKIITSSAKLLKAEPVVYYVFRDGIHMVLTILQKLPSPCEAEE